MNIAGKEGDVNPETIDSWNERVKELTKGYSPRDVWNEDESGCSWNAMPEKSLSLKGKLQSWQECEATNNRCILCEFRGQERGPYCDRK